MRQVATLGQMGVLGWTAYFGFFSLLLVCLYLLHLVDERQLQTGFMPRWHRLLMRLCTCGGEGTARNRRFTRWLTIGLIWFFTNHAILSVFFILPWSALTRARSLMIAVNALLAGTNVLFLFWSTYTAFSGDDWQEEPASASHALWSFLLNEVFDMVVTLLCAFAFQLAQVSAFDKSFFLSNDDEEDDVRAARQRKVRDAAVAWEAAKTGGAKSPRGERRNSHISDHIESDTTIDRRVEELSGWNLIFRHTAPKPWPSAEHLAVSPWDPTADLFATLDPATIERFRDPADGVLTLRMRWRDASAASGNTLGSSLLRWAKGLVQSGDKDAVEHANIWRQRSSPMEPRADVDGYEPLRICHGGGEFGGLRGSRTRLHHLCHGTRRPHRGSSSGQQRGAAARDALFVVGQLHLNAHGGLTGWEASSRGTAVSVELYVLDPYSDAAHDLRELREAGPVAVPLAAVAAPAPAKDATDGNRGELVEVEVTGAEGTERGVAAPEDVEVGVIQPKTKGAKALEALHLTAERRKRLGNSLQIRARITQVKRLLYAQLEVVEDARSTFRYKPTINMKGEPAVVLDVVRVQPEWLLVTRSHIGLFVRTPLDSGGFKSGKVTRMQPPTRERPGPEDVDDGCEPVIRYVPVRRIFRHAGDSIWRPRRLYVEFVRASDEEKIESDEIIRRCAARGRTPHPVPHHCACRSRPEGENARCAGQ